MLNDTARSDSDMEKKRSGKWPEPAFVEQEKIHLDFRTKSLEFASHTSQYDNRTAMQVPVGLHRAVSWPLLIASCR
ncbi:hypothetical protein [Azotobacter vinelandii]|uniref:hypothetical protein n=1 Tax=Azotobacter vinelandii TaxID=354 RepID=UPI0007747192|nr:hypothetical protein [Azotobacter vinelandii]WKN20685.1 hypothetical protein AVAEIV_003693 [Azotobacter vinelandii]